MVAIHASIGRKTWHLSGTVGALVVDVYFDVVGAYQWQEHVDASKLIDPCTRAETMEVTSDGTRGLLFGTPTMRTGGRQRKAAKDALRDAWEAVGPYTLVTPTETLVVQFDGSQDWTAQNIGPAWLCTARLQEVPPATVPIVPPPPPGPLPGPTSTTLTANFPFVDPAVEPHLGVNWTNFASPTGSDFVGLYHITDPITIRTGDAIIWAGTGGAITGSTILDFTGLPAGTGYQLRGVYGSVPSVVLGPNLEVR